MQTTFMQLFVSIRVWPEYIFYKDSNKQGGSTVTAGGGVESW